MIEIGHFSHPGKQRTLNEDTYDILIPERLALVVDGIGGAQAGDVASAFIREQIQKNLLNGDDLLSAIHNAGHAIRTQRPQQGNNPSGASVVIMQWQQNTCQIAWVGACRAYFFDGEQTQLLSDTKSPQEKHAVKNTAVNSVQALGITTTEKLHIQHWQGNWGGSQAVLLCSDGLHEDCSLSQIHAVLSDLALSAQEAAEHLLYHALQGAALNNMSAILLRQT